MNKTSYPGDTGTRIAPGNRKSSNGCKSIQVVPTTVLDILNLQEATRPGIHEVAEMRTALARAAEFLGSDISELRIESLLGLEPEFSNYLRERRYKHTTARIYRFLIRKLIATARQYGWAPLVGHISESWIPILSRIKNSHTGLRFAEFCIERRLLPENVSEDHLNAFCQLRTRSGRIYRYVDKYKSSTRQRLRKAGTACFFPSLDCSSRTRSPYKIRLSEMPESLRSEIEAILAWKKAVFSPGRPAGARHREVSAGLLRERFEYLYGFAVNILGVTGIGHLSDLVCKNIVTAFVAWSINDRNHKRETLMKLCLIHAAVRHYPALKKVSFDWFPDLIGQIPDDPEGERLERKARKYLPYDTVALIPAAIRLDVEKAQKRGDQKEVALLVQDSLLISLLLTLAWRQRNVRECRIGDAEKDNVFLAELPSFIHVAKPEWVDKLLRDEPHPRIWQFYFREHETKIGRAVRGIIPRKLIPLIEDFVQNHRPVLVGNAAHRNLFVNVKGDPFEDDVLRTRVGRICSNYGGRRVTPHIFRDIVAYKWLEDHPEDYLTLSKILWHTNVNTTLQIYGRNYDESNGAVRLDEWLSE